jgi:hypothetical protein
MVGIWEGIVLHYFSQMSAPPLEPYIACGIRSFIDIIFTGNVSRTVVIVVWTGLTALVCDSMRGGHWNTDDVHNNDSPSVPWTRSQSQSYAVISITRQSSRFSTPLAVALHRL